MDKPINALKLDASMTEASPQPSATAGSSASVQSDEAKEDASSYLTSCADFFEKRFLKAFPGGEGQVKWFTEAEQIDERLALLFRHPLTIRTAYKPIWWYRGPRSDSIDEARRLSAGNWLIDHQELCISRIAAIHFGTYWNCFVLIEADPVSPSNGMWPSKSEFEAEKSSLGFVSERAYLFKGRYIARDKVSGCSAEIDGEAVDLEGPLEYRERCLTRYNLLIAAHDSALNNTNADDQIREHLDQMLNGSEVAFEALRQTVMKLPKQVRYL